jgi:hypothetical protein
MRLAYLLILTFTILHQTKSDVISFYVDYFNFDNSLG